MSTENDDVTDAELLAEIEAEIEKEALNANTSTTTTTTTTTTTAAAANNNQNDTVPLNDTSNILNGTASGHAIPDANSYDGGAQLTQFQDSVITTGSDVSILLMVILAILFIIQLIRKSHQHFRLQSMIKNVENPLDSARPMAAENLTPINPRYDHNAVAVYNTEFEDKKVFLQRQNDGAPPSVLKDILLKRAAKCVEKADVLRRDGMGIRKNWLMDLLPRDVWDDFNAAQRNLQQEINSVAQENQRYQFNWGQPHGTNVFSKARDEHQRKMFIQNKVMQQKIQQQRQMQQQHAQQQPHRQQAQSATAASQQGAAAGGGGQSQHAPSAKAFGNGFTPGFFNSGSNANASGGGGGAGDGKKLSKKEKKELNKQKKQMKHSGNTAMAANAGMQNGVGDASSGATTTQQQQQVRRRKGKHRFANK
mmetsp:Transcript_32641/g.52939  ORF Transcript_32641/g.52939 Transcript_32641/m.52939 type:complete len:422 (-) Transcript_32641:1113-2378(-)